MTFDNKNTSSNRGDRETGRKKHFTSNNFRKGGSKFAKKLLTPEEKEKLEARKLRKKKFFATYEALQKEFPHAFDEKKIKPLIKDVHLELFKYFDSANADTTSPVRKSAIRVFLSSYIRSEAYNKACVQLKRRYNLKGNVVADITPEEVKYHQSLIKDRPRFNKRFSNRTSGKFNNDANTEGQRAKSTFNPSLAFKEGANIYIVETKKEGRVKSFDGRFVTLVLDGTSVVLRLPYQKVRLNKRKA